MTKKKAIETVEELISFCSLNREITDSVITDTELESIQYLLNYIKKKDERIN